MSIWSKKNTLNYLNKRYSLYELVLDECLELTSVYIILKATFKIVFFHYIVIKLLKRK